MEHIKVIIAQGILCKMTEGKCRGNWGVTQIDRLIVQLLFDVSDQCQAFSEQSCLLLYYFYFCRSGLFPAVLALCSATWPGLLQLQRGSIITANSSHTSASDSQTHVYYACACANVSTMVTPDSAEFLSLFIIYLGAFTPFAACSVVRQFCNSSEVLFCTRDGWNGIFLNVIKYFLR